LEEICIYLAKEIARDGEGASKLIEVTVDGAANTNSARLAARTVVSSSLVKSAVHGADPNWGRVMAALGRSGAEVEEDKVALYVNDVCIMEAGRPIPFHKDGVVVLMNGPEVSFRIKLNLGEGKATAWGCNLSEEYVTFNSGYTT
jgi:glutamate N-acetyltransferase/amino-acid N-acetyltransferase